MDDSIWCVQTSAQKLNWKTFREYFILSKLWGLYCYIGIWRQPKCITTFIRFVINAIEFEWRITFTNLYSVIYWPKLWILLYRTAKNHLLFVALIHFKDFAVELAAKTHNPELANCVSTNTTNSTMVLLRDFVKSWSTLPTSQVIVFSLIWR